MKIEDVKNRPRKERRICRANLRLYPSQMKFIEDNDLSVQAIFDKALDELGHKAPNIDEIEKLAQKYKPKILRAGNNRRSRKIQR